MKTTRQGIPTQLTCRGALYGYPGSWLSNSDFLLVQDVNLRIEIFRYYCNQAIFAIS